MALKKNTKHQSADKSKRTRVLNTTIGENLHAEALIDAIVDDGQPAEEGYSYEEEKPAAPEEDIPESHKKAISDMRVTLDSLGVKWEAKDTIEQLALRLRRGIDDIGEKKPTEENDAVIRAWGGNTRITDLKFLRRLKKMGIKPFYVRGIMNPKNPDAPLRYLFDDTHARLADKDIHKIIRHSNAFEMDPSKALRAVGEQPRLPPQYRAMMKDEL